MKKKPGKAWDYLGQLYLHNGDISYREIGKKFGIRDCSVGLALSRLPKNKKFSSLKGNNLLPNQQ